MATREEIFREQLEHIKEANNSSAPNGTPREALEAFIDFYSGMFPYLEPFFETMKGPILDTYDLLENRTETLNNYLDMLENEFNNGGGTSPGGTTPGGGGTSPGGTSPGGTTPGGGGTSPGGNTPSGTTPGGTTPGGGGGTGPGGHPHPYNPETPQPHDPLVLDMNQDGKISTIALADSQVFFDITGDGVKERVGWVAPQDGLLVYDKNRNGIIDGIGEVFGKDGLSGFAELRSVADTNYDNIIDRRDELYSQLKVWQDTNGDGISQANELKSLSQAGVKNIELNVIGTNINLEGNILSEAGRYGDTVGDRELAADIQLLATERVNSSTTADTYEIDPITETLPQMRGYGYVDNSFKAYNLDSKIQRKAA